MISDMIAYGFVFLVVYIVLYFVLGFFFKDTYSQDFDIILSRTFDAFVVILLMIAFITMVYTVPKTNVNDWFSDINNQVLSFLESPVSLIYLSMILIFIYSMVYLFRIPMTNGAKPFSIAILENGTWILFVIVLLQTCVNLFLGIDLIAEMENIFTKKKTTSSAAAKTTTDSNSQKKQTNSSGPSSQGSSSGNVVASSKTISNTGNAVPSSTGSASSGGSGPSSGNMVATSLTPTATPTATPQESNEVFNVSGNHYTYDDAEAICAAYGATLANYDQIEEAYNDGAEWCNYGWSADQMAFFPTQKETWNTLQKNPKTANNCGRPGVNGGFMENKSLRFGVNCYGKKPAPKPGEFNPTVNQAAKVANSIPLTPEEEAMNQKIAFWKQNAARLLNLNSFNQQKWSEH